MMRKKSILIVFKIERITSEAYEKIYNESNYFLVDLYIGLPK